MIFFFIVLLFLCEVSNAQNIEIPRSYIAYKTSENLIIDGQANEKSWKESTWTDDFINIEGMIVPKYRTRMKILWDNNYMYFYAEMEEPHVWASLRQKDTLVYHDNDFEIFINPDGNTHNYFEIQINALNTISDIYFHKPPREGSPKINDWDIKGLKTAVHINGTLNDSEDYDEGWSIEVAVPWNSLTKIISKDAIPVNEFWRVNFSRVNWEFVLTDGVYERAKGKTGKPLPEYNWVWSPQFIINMHQPERWGYIYFSKEQSEANTKFQIPEDEKIKWYLYAIYRLVKKDNLKVDHELKIEDLILDGYAKRYNIEKALLPNFEKHSAGWNIILKSPYSGKAYTIREDGLFLEIP